LEKEYDGKTTGKNEDRERLEDESGDEQEEE
jgi:hypothetical protein